MLGDKIRIKNGLEGYDCNKDGIFMNKCQVLDMIQTPTSKIQNAEMWHTCELHVKLKCMVLLISQYDLEVN